MKKSTKPAPRSTKKPAPFQKSKGPRPDSGKSTRPKTLGASKKTGAKFFEPDPKDANTVNSIRAKLEQLQQYKRILADDGLMPDAEDKELESDLIRQLIRIEKGLSPKRPPKPTRKAKLASKASKTPE